MELKINMCYSLLLKLMLDPQFIKSCNGLSYNKPNYECAGVSGYVSTDVVIQVGDISGFADAYNRVRLDNGSEICEEIWRLVHTKL